MCLRRVTSRPKPSNKIQRGFKGFDVLYKGFDVRFFDEPSKVDGYPAFPCFKRVQKLKIGVWMRAKGSKKGLIGYPGHEYPTGFHICKRKRGANAWGRATLMVEFKGVHTIGTDIGVVFVANWLRVPKSEYKAFVQWHNWTRRYVTKTKEKACARR